MPDELEQLFPQLKGVLDNWGAMRTSMESIPTDEHGGVTDEAVAEYVASRFGRVGPAPVVDRRDDGRRFASGTGAPPPTQTIVEDGAPVNARPTTPPPSPSEPPFVPAPDLDQASQESEPGSSDAGDDLDLASQGQGTGEPTTAPSTPHTIRIGDRDVDYDKAVAYVALDDAMATDPRFARFVGQYLTTGVVPFEIREPVAPTPTAPIPVAGVDTPVPPLLAPIPDLPAEYADDPALQAILQGQRQLAEQQLQITRALQAQQQQQFAEAQVQSQSLVTRAVRDFQSRYELTDDEMRKVEEATARTNLVPTFMRGVHPIYGTPFKADPIAAVDGALSIVFNNMPEFVQRQNERARAKAREDHARKQKLAGVSGSSGSVPRATPALPNNEQGRRAAMTAEVAQMMSGNWSGN